MRSLARQCMLAFTGVYLLLCVPVVCLGELWPSLDAYVEECVLIVKARTEVAHDGILTFRVLETWKGKYDPQDFVRTTEDGRFFAAQHEHGVEVADGQEVVFFFTPLNQLVPGKLSRHSTAFPIRDGKVTYATTSDWLREVLAIDRFRRQILDLVEGVETEIISARRLRGSVGEWGCWDGASEPQWSPDGRTIAFTRRLDRVGEGRHVRYRKPEIWMVASDGSNMRCLGEGQKLFWSEPNTLVYSYGAETGTEVATHFAVIDLRTGGRTELAQSPVIPAASFEWFGQTYSVPDAKVSSEGPADAAEGGLCARFDDQCRHFGLHLNDLEVRRGAVLLTRSYLKFKIHPWNDIVCLISDDLQQAKVIVRDAKQPAISPDGRKLAFIRNGSLWIRKLQGPLPAVATDPSLHR